MRQGKSDAEIKHYLTARYSDFVLYYNPPLRGGTALLWFRPLAGSAAGRRHRRYRIVRRRAKAALTCRLRQFRGRLVMTLFVVLAALMRRLWPFRFGHCLRSRDLMVTANGC